MRRFIEFNFRIGIPDREQSAEPKHNLKKERQPKKKIALKKGIARLLLAAFLVLCAIVTMTVGVNFAMNRNFEETFYKIVSYKANENIRILHFSDLHNSTFGENNKNLVERTEKLAPDIIVMSGDIVNRHDKSQEIAIDLCGKLTKIAPVYYIYGNNECSIEYGFDMTLNSLESLDGQSADVHDISKITEEYTELKNSLEAAGVTVLLNETETIEVKGMSIDIYGVLASNPSSFWSYAGEAYKSYLTQNSGHFKLLICHEPYIFESLKDEYWGDLALCGHTHGGVVRLPGIGGLYEQTHKFFPEKIGDTHYIAGRYNVDNMPLIVSRGLTNRGAVRVNNKPELVVIDIGR